MDGKQDCIDVNPGAIAQCRGREWVLLPSGQEDLRLPRPLTGWAGKFVIIHERLTNLIGFSSPEVGVGSAKLPLPELTKTEV
jgi:hypothetical protein